jgi:CheY-like chemotaxis protein
MPNRDATLHDIRNYLAVISAALDILEADETLPADTKRVLATARQAGRALAALASGPAYRVQTETKSKRRKDFLDLADLLFEMGEMCAIAHPKIRVDYFIKDPVPVMGNPDELRRMLLNVLINSVQAMPDGGVISISSRKNSECFLVEIGDTGKGMDPKTMKRIFEDGFSNKGSSGIGLSIVRDIAASHGWEMDVSSQPGRGTEFRFRIPVQSSRKRILMIDDEPNFLELVGIALEEDGYRVFTSPTGEFALEMLPKIVPIDCIVSDNKMPGIGGLETIKRIHEKFPTIPALMLVGDTSDPGIAQAREQGIVSSIIPKPCTLHHLKDTIRRLTGTGEEVNKKRNPIAA